MDEIKDAFQKVKQDISYLNYELQSLKVSFAEFNWNIARLTEDIKELKLQKQQHFVQKEDNSNYKSTTTHATQNSIHPTHNPTDNSSFKPLKPQILPISIGNEGGPTDRQTDRQTDQHILPTQFLSQKTPHNKPENTLQDASKILDSLDTLKKEIRLKFKRLTEKEILVFSTLYQLEEDQGYADYKAIAQRLNLTESSIREYVGKIISKGIPIDKTKLNNKNIQLNVSGGLKRVVSLQTILKLREL